MDGLVVCIPTMVMIGTVLYSDPVGEPHGGQPHLRGPHGGEPHGEPHGEPRGGEPPRGQPQDVVNSSIVDHRYVIFVGETAWLVHETKDKN